MPPNVSDAYNQLQSFNSSRPAASSYFDQANQKYGVDAANQQVSGLQSLVGNLTNAANAVAPSVAGRTSGTFTTQGQRDALVNREQAPIISNINTNNQALGQAQTAQSQAQQMAQQMAGTLASQDQTKYQTLLDQYNAANAADQFQKQLASAQQQAASDQAFRQQQLAEQVRQFNNPQRSSAGGDIASLFGGAAKTGGQAGALTGGKNSDQANSAIQQLLKTNNAGTITNTINAIQKSAGYGNTYDQAKLEILHHLAPGIFQGNNLNTGYLQRTLGTGIKLF